ncbi:ribosome biogenesis protein WDR12 homolog isoform X2 [Salvia miltiorrhiza]|uniref:ribosome biogenesis protein WDR12 homolog isoform X2 n=1 Tax=Salvia miltiorrhiza TaxID=226208 RepID=UPI0025AC497C|nr:ribosome biogenesis protein WDR12 homolog isoform X2 [Salvia miltiorrhiza]
MDIHPDEEGEAKQVQVRFITKLQQPYKVQQASISIPANLTRFGLSALVNNLLLTSNADWTTEPFDFLIDGELVRMSLEEFLLAKGISAEKVLEIEYIKAVAPRNQEEPSLHDDWVSAVDGSNDGYILTGCYDDLGRVWKAGGICTHVLDGHSGPLTSVCNLMPKVDSIVGQVVATGSKDRTLRLWKFGEEDPIDQTKKIRSVKVLRGHTDAVQSIAAIPSGDVVCSGSWDCTINLWNTTANDPEDSVSVKKRKKGGQDKEALSESCGKAINSLSIGGESCALIAAGSSDPVLRVWDPRKPGTLSPIFQFSSHNSWISSCKWHDKSWYHLASASYDGKVMLWDLRTAWPLSVIDTHGDKVLCADWWKGDSVVSGGADSKLRISSGVSVM